MTQYNCFPSWTDTICLFNAPFCVKLEGYKEHWNLSPSWIDAIWMMRETFDLKILEQASQLDPIRWIIF